METPSIDRTFVMWLLNDVVAINSVNPDVDDGPGEVMLPNMFFDWLTPISQLRCR